MRSFRSLLVSLFAGLGVLAGSSHAQDIAAATLPRTVTVGPRLLIVQKTISGLRWRGFNLATNSWSPWATTTTLGSHFDGYDRVGLAGFDDGGTARYHAFEAVIKAGGAIHVAETVWDFAGAQPVSTPPTQGAPNTATGSFFFPKDAVGRNSARSFSVFGSCVGSNGSGLVYAPRELIRPVVFRDMAVPADATPEIFIGPNSTTLREWSPTSFDRTTAVMHQTISGVRTITLYSVGDAIMPAVPDTKVNMGSPPGIMTQAPLLFIHDNDINGPMNLFTVARDSTGRRRLFERFFQITPGAVTVWSGWKDRGFPAGAPVPASDDMEMVAALVWRTPNTGILRVNMFGTRGDQLVEWHWNGAAWTWGALVAMPAPGMRVTDGAVITRIGFMPRLSIFAVTPAGIPFEFVFDDRVGSWSWRSLN